MSRSGVRDAEDAGVIGSVAGGMWEGVAATADGRGGRRAAVAREWALQQGDELGSVHVGEEVEGGGVRVAVAVKDVEKAAETAAVAGCRGMACKMERSKINTQHKEFIAQYKVFNRYVVT